MEPIKRTIVPLEVSVLKTGTSSKDGKSWQWHLYKVKAKVLPKDTAQEFTTFDDFRGREGQEVEVEISENNYTDKEGKERKGWQIKLPKRNVWDAIKSIEDRLDKLARQGNVSDEKPEVPGIGAEDIMADDIPF